MYIPVISIYCILYMYMYMWIQLYSNPVSLVATTCMQLCMHNSCTLTALNQHIIVGREMLVDNTSSQLLSRFSQTYLLNGRLTGTKKWYSSIPYLFLIHLPPPSLSLPPPSLSLSLLPQKQTYNFSHWLSEQIITYVHRCFLCVWCIFASIGW